MRHTATICMVCLAAAVLLAGCGLRDPSLPSTTSTGSRVSANASTVQTTTTTSSSSASQTASTQAMTETTPAMAAPSLPRTSQAALQRFATAWVTWTVGAQAPQRKQLLTQATGPLLSQLDGVEAQVPRGPQGAGSGRYVGAIRQSANRFLVVTYELAGAGSQAQATYDVYLATVVNTRSGWKLSAWIPTSS